MSEQIVININRLGPVRNARITLGQFMIFSGASGLGKSYTAMLVHYVYRILSGEELEGFFKEKQATLGDVSRFEDTAMHVVFSCESSELVQWINAHARTYLVNMLAHPQLDMDVQIEFPALSKTLLFEYGHIEQVEQDDISRPNLSPRGRLKLSPFGGATTFSLTLLPQINYALFSHVLSIHMADLYGLRLITSTFFLPPSRGAIMQIPMDKQLSVFQSTPMYSEFIETFARIKSFREVEISVINTKSIADGRIEEFEGELYYNYHDVPIPISAAASSIKEIAPFVMLAEKGLSRYFATLFEEPESHLHPELQGAVVDVMAQMLHHGTHLQITTHSDYVMRRINDLIYLYRLSEAWKIEKYAKFCEQRGIDGSITLDPDIIKAYFFKPEDGGLSSIVEQDISNGIPFSTFEKVINTNFPISADIYEQFEIMKQ